MFDRLTFLLIWGGDDASREDTNTKKVWYHLMLVGRRIKIKLPFYIFKLQIAILIPKNEEKVRMCCL